MSGITAAVVTNDVVTNAVVTNDRVEGGGAVAPTFNSLVAALLPVIDYRYDAAAGALINHGSAANFDVPLVSEVAARQVTNGDLLDPGFCMTWDGSPATEGFRKASAFAGIESLTAGSIIVVYRTADTGGLKVAQDGLGTFFYQPRFIIAGAADNGFQQLMGGGGGTWLISTSLGANGGNDGNWHVTVIAQPGDGSGPDGWHDGSSVGVTVNVGVGQEDNWFADGAPYTEWTIGHGENNANPWVGQLDRYIITNSVLTQADAQTLFDIYRDV